MSMRRATSRWRLLAIVAAAIVVAGCMRGASTASSKVPAASVAVSPPASASSPAVTPAPLPSTPSAPPTTPVAPATVASASQAGDAWQPVPHPASIVDVQFQDVTWTGTRFVALGFNQFLDSPDGLTWNVQPGIVANSSLRAVAAGPNGVVAVGSLNDRSSSWFSPDGLTWTASSTGFLMAQAGASTVAYSASDGGLDSAEVTDVVETGDGWLAVGRQDSSPCASDCGTAPIRALVWTSPDGLRWTRVADQASLGGGGMDTVVRGGPGFVAAGNAAGVAAIWTSTSGSIWSRVPDREMFHPRPGPNARDQLTTAMGAASGHGVVVVVGSDNGAQDIGFDNGVRAWWSLDGRTWDEAAAQPFAEDQMWGAASTAAGFLATGPSGEPGCLGGIWASTDGRAWRCVASETTFAGFSACAAAASSSVEVVVGFADTGDDEDPTTRGAAWWRAVP